MCNQHRLSRSAALLLALSTLAGGSAVAADIDPWPSLKDEIFGAREVAENDNAVTLYAPDNAEDAALVPVTIRMRPDVANAAKTLTLIVDRNPAPIAATFRFGEGYKASGEVGERMISTRLRVDSFAKVRAVLETADGKLHMAAKFVAGAGGCSSPGSKDPEEAVAQLGAVKVTFVADGNRDTNWREGAVMIRHPNFTGMQMGKDASYVPARFVNTIEVKRGDDLVFRVDGGISIAENPHIRFNLQGRTGDALTLVATDTAGAVFHGQSSMNGS